MRGSGLQASLIFVLSPLLALAMSSKAYGEASGIRVIGVLTSPLDKEAVESGFKFNMDNLRDCGVSVEEIVIDPKNVKESLKQTAARISELDLKSEDLVWIEGHGVVLKDGKTPKGIPYPYGRIDDGFYFCGTTPDYNRCDLLFKGDTLLDLFTKPTGRPTERKVSIWIDTCNAGGCTTYGKACVGAVCKADQNSVNASAASKVLTKLLCSESSDCALWNKWDRDRNGTISSSEMDDFFAEQDNLGICPRVAKTEIVVKDELKSKTEEMTKLCAKLRDGKVEAREQGHAYDLIYRYKTASGRTEDKKVEASFWTVTDFIREIFPNDFKSELEAKKSINIEKYLVPPLKDTQHLNLFKSTKDAEDLQAALKKYEMGQNKNSRLVTVALRPASPASFRYVLTCTHMATGSKDRNPDFENFSLTSKRCPALRRTN